MSGMTERAKLVGGNTDITVSARILNARGGTPEQGEQSVASGGVVSFMVYNREGIRGLQTSPSAVSVEFLRWRAGVKYNVKSCEPIHGGRYLRVEAERKN